MAYPLLADLVDEGLESWSSRMSSNSQVSCCQYQYMKQDIAQTGAFLRFCHNSCMCPEQGSGLRR